MGNLWKMGSVVQRVIVVNHIENKGEVKKNRSNSTCLRAETHRPAFFHFPRAYCSEPRPFNLESWSPTRRQRRVNLSTRERLGFV